MYGVESREEYGIATLLDPRYKFAGFRSRDNATLAKEILIEEMVTANSVEGGQRCETPKVQPLKLFSTAKHVLGQTRLSMKPKNMEQNLLLKYELRASGYGRLSDVPEDFVSPNAVSIPKPIISDTAPELEEIDIEIYISSDESDNEG